MGIEVNEFAQICVKLEAKLSEELQPSQSQKELVLGVIHLVRTQSFPNN